MKFFAKPSIWLSSILITLIQRFSLFIFGLLGFFILTHYAFSNEEIGVYALFQTITNMMEYVKMGLLRNAYIKFTHDNRFSNRVQDFQSASLLINVLFSGIIVLVFLFGSNWISGILNTPSLATLLKWASLLIILLVPFNHCEIILQSNLRFKRIFIAYFIRQGLLFLFILSTFIFAKKLLTVEFLVLAQLAAMTLASMYILIASRKFLKAAFYIDREIVSKLFQFGKYVFGTATLSHFYKFADHFVTAYAIGDPVTGKIYVSYYNVVARISGAMDLPFMAASDVLFPKNAQAMAKGGIENVTYHFERLVGTLTALFIPASLFIFSVPYFVIGIIAGPDYFNAVPILQLTMGFAFLRPFITQFGYTMDSIGKPQVNFVVNCIFLLISITSTYASIRIFGGLMGAVYATVFTGITGCIMFYFILRRHLQISISNILHYMVQTYRDIFNFIKKIRVQSS